MNFHNEKNIQAIRHKLPPTVSNIFSVPPPLRYNGQSYEVGPVVPTFVRKTKAFEIVHFRQGMLITISSLTELLKFCQHSKAAIENYDSVRYIPEQPDCKIALQNLFKGLNYAEDSRHNKEFEELDLVGLVNFGQTLCNQLQVNLLLLQQFLGKNEFFPNDQNTTNPTSQFRHTSTVPQLQYFTPDRYVKFRKDFMTYKQEQGWNEEVAKSKLIENINPHMQSPLNLNLAQYKYCSLSDIFGFWDENVFPDVTKQHAFALANLRQNKNEAAAAFVSRAKVLYRKHCAANVSDGALDTDEALIFNLIRGLFDRQLVAYLVDKKVETVSQLRSIIDFYYHCVKTDKVRPANVLQKGCRVKGFKKRIPPKNLKNAKRIQK